MKMELTIKHAGTEKKVGFIRWAAFRAAGILSALHQRLYWASYRLRDYAITGSWDEIPF